MIIQILVEPALFTHKNNRHGNKEEKEKNALPLLVRFIFFNYYITVKRWGILNSNREDKTFQLTQFFMSSWVNFQLSREYSI